LAEILVSMLILMVGTLATLSLVASSNSVLSQTRAREGAVNLSRELLERAHNTSYAQVGDPNWFRTSLEGTPGQSGSIDAAGGNGNQTNVDRRGTIYTVSVSACSVDDASDGYGAHTTGSHAWCTDSATAGSEDAQAEDFKRIATTITWLFGGKSQRPLVQTATFAANGAAIGPSTTNLVITSPSGLSPTAPTITSPSTTSVMFQGTSVGASDMRFSVDGVEQTTGVTNAGTGNWQFTWDISQLTDGTYTIGATAMDALGARGPAHTLQVKLARGLPVAPRNVTGDYNYVYVSGARTLAVELSWDANPEGNVTGYEVMKGSTTVCSASLAISCIDLSPAGSGSTTYTVRTLFIDGTGSTSAVSTNYPVTAPVLLPPSYVGNIGSATACGTDRATITVPSGGVSAGNRVVIRLYQRGGSTSGTVSAFDSKGNSYAVDANYLTSTAILSANVSNALVAGDTIQVNFPTADAAGVVADAYSNIATTSAVDANASATGSSGPSVSVATTNASDLIVGAVGSANNRTVTQPANWTGLVSAFPDCGGASKKGTITGAYRTPGATGSFTYNPVLGGSGTWSAAAVAYKPGGATNAATPSTPTGLSVTVNGDGTRTLTWTAPSGGPAVELYRIYRDGRDYTDRIDSAGATGSTVTWTDTDTGSTSHTYRVTAATATLVESGFAGPVSG
jgi:Tfp pilus assembly protein PilV